MWSLALAEKTDKTLRSEINTFLLVCHKFGWNPVPVSEVTLLRYAVVLGKSLAYVSVKRYLGAVKHLHNAWGESCAVGKSYHLYRVLLGIKREKGAMSSSKLHVTPEILKDIYRTLDFTAPNDLAFWCACVVAFLTFFRKSNLCVESERKFNPDRDLCKADISVEEDTVKVTVRWSKTIQFKERVLEIPLHRARGTIFDVGAVWMAYAKRDTGKEGDTAFGIVNTRGWRSPMTHSWFGKRLKQALNETGRDSSRYSGHSFRSGGATFAFEQGLPAEVVKMQGDWVSDAYLRYVRIEWGTKLKAARVMAEGLVEWTSKAK